MLLFIVHWKLVFTLNNAKGTKSGLGRIINKAKGKHKNGPGAHFGTQFYKTISSSNHAG